MNVGRVATTVVVGLGIIWIPIMRAISDGGLYDYLQGVQSYLAPSIASVFLLGIFWKRMNTKGAMWGLLSGFVLGMLKLTAQTMFGHGKMENPAILAWIGDFNQFYAGGVLIVICVLVIIAASLLSEESSEKQTKGLTYAWLKSDPAACAEISASWTKTNKLFMWIIIVGCLAMYLYFTFWLS